MTFDQLARMTDGELYNPAMVGRMFDGVSIDSRTIRPGELYVAIRGEHNDGHLFIPSAITAGAAGLLSEINCFDPDNIPSDLPVVAVKNSHEAMMLLAERLRPVLDARIIGITGSNGKTTTKEWTYQLLQTVEKRSYRSAGNWNNLYGMPLAMFAMPSDTRLAVMEMGISRPNEMTRLAKIVQPDIILITNVGPSHLEFLGSVTGVAQAKLEMVAVADKSTPIIINADDEVLVAEASKLRGGFITFGIDNPATFMIDKIESLTDGTTITIEGKRLKLPLSGRHHVYNLLAAWAACRTAGFDFAEVDTEQIQFLTDKMRGEKIDLGGIQYIVDCYNANPESVKSAIEAITAETTTGRRILILGDMLELGDNAPEYHRSVGRLVAQGNPDLLVTVGELSRHICDGAVTAGFPSEKITQFGNIEDATNQIASILAEGDLVLLKASRGVKLERLLDGLKKEEVN